MIETIDKDIDTLLVLLREHHDDLTNDTRVAIAAQLNALSSLRTSYVMELK